MQTLDIKELLFNTDANKKEFVDEFSFDVFYSSSSYVSNIFS